MVQIYIKHTDNNYYVLDLDSDEAINSKLTVRDLGDISKIFSPFTQSFNIKATDKNKILCGFIGNEKIARVNTTGVFDAMIYISGFLYQAGKLTFDEMDYVLSEQKSFKTNFASNLTSLTDKLGDLTVQDLFDADPLLKIDWNITEMRTLMGSVQNKTLANGIEFKYGIPFISNNRKWTYNDSDLGIIDNIAFKASRTTVNQISILEVRPAINFMSIMRHLINKIGVPVTSPIFDKPEVKDAFVWCNSETLVDQNATALPLVNYSALTYLRFDVKDTGIGGTTPPLQGEERWLITGGGANGVFKATQNNAAIRHANWSDGFNINLTFNEVLSLDGTEPKIKVILKNSITAIAIDSQEVTTNVYSFRLLNTMLDSSGELFFKFDILPMTLVSWERIEFQTVQIFSYKKRTLFIVGKVEATFTATALNLTASASLGGNQFNLITTLPKMKCTDFLKSFFKTFNISVISTGKQDQSMFWLTPSDIQEVNKEYSKRVVDYTQFVDTATLTKGKSNEYNQYAFSHFNTKYFGDGLSFGSLNYPEATPPNKPTKFEVKTDYSILNQGASFTHPSGAKTCFGFSNDTPTVLENGAVRYKPVYEEFTLFYLQGKSLEFNTLSIELAPNTNAELNSVLEASYRNSFNGKTLAFGAVNINTDSLYLNYYSTFIEMLLKANTYKSEFTLTLPPNEIFLNFANLTQGESNIPTGFRPQNEIIIGEQRYTLVDSTINLTTGKTKLTLLNL